MPHPMEYRRDIDGLRAMAVLAVVAYHVSPQILPGGYVGVDVFFVISGYLITSILLADHEKGQFSFAHFYARRARRIFPPLFLVLLSTFGLGWLALMPDEFERLGWHIFAGAAFFENILLWTESGYFDQSAAQKPLLHLWSLGVEEQFYLAFPLALALAIRLKVSPLKAIIAVAVVSFVFNVSTVSIDVSGAFYLPHTRMWELMAGAAIAALPNLLKLSPRFAEGIAMLGCLLLAFAFLKLHEGRLFPGWWALVPVVGSMLLIIAGPTTLIARMVFSNPLAVGIGLISYSLYLWHWPLISFLNITEYGTPPRHLRIGAVALSFVLAIATYWMIERPIRAGGSLSVKALGSSAALALAASMGLAVATAQGFPNRVADLEDRRGQLEWGAAERFSDGCADTIMDLPYCLRTGRTFDTALIGDSHANSLAHGMLLDFEKRGRGLVHLAGSGCVPFYNVDAYKLGEQSNECRTQMNSALDFAASSPDIETIILSFYGVRNIAGDVLGDPSRGQKVMVWQDDTTLRASQAFEGAMRATMRTLSQAGKRIVFVVDWPELGFDIRSCAPVRPIRLTSSTIDPCGLSAETYFSRASEYRSIVAAVLSDFPDAITFDPAQTLCTENWCTAEIENNLLYLDRHHLSRFGSEYLSRALLREVEF